MKQIFLTCCLMAGVFLLHSCGTAKKLEQATEQVNQLQAANTQLNEKVSGLESNIADLKKQNAQLGAEAADAIEMKVAIENNLKAINRAMSEEGTSLRKIQEKAEAALSKFDEAGIDVSYNRGLVYIAMNDLLMFKSGSAVLSAEGKDALSVVADVLNENPKVKVYVIGNTDDQMVKSGFKDNWSLSTERANAIVRILRDDYQVDPVRLTAAGRGKYNPIADNSSAEGKARNRRTEIVLNPDLGRFWEIAKEEQ